MRKGILTRIYAPMVSSHAWNLLSGFCPKQFTVLLVKSLNFSTQNLSLQVIIQSLRESGVFSSVISKSDQTKLSKEKFLNSVESSNSTRNSRSEMLSSRKIDAGGLSQETARRILEVIDDSLPSAIPPLSPPSLDHADLITF